MDSVGAKEISARTRLLAILGHPVGHSLSPRIHNAALRSQGVDAVYLAFDVTPDELSQAIQGIRAMRVMGANITVPHKEQAATLVDTLDPLAARVGAINTIVNQDGRLTGYNTDVMGFSAALASVRPDLQDARCLVVGAGGAARAVVAALAQQRAKTITVANRTESRSIQLCEDAEQWGDSECVARPIADLTALVRDADILVNASSIGMAETIKESPIPVDILTGHHLVVDLVYGPRPTTLVTGAVSHGAVAIDGLEMLLRQAAESYKLWTGRTAPIQIMRASIE